MRHTVLIAAFPLLITIPLSCIGETSVLIAKVTTSKGALKLHSQADEHSRILDEIPNGTCILVLEEESA